MCTTRIQRRRELGFPRHFLLGDWESRRRWLNSGALSASTVKKRAGAVVIPEDFTIVRPNCKEHGERLFDLIAKTFPYPSYYGMLQACRGRYINQSHYDWNASRIGLIGGEIVTHYGVWGYRMRVGSARLRCAGVGVVATREDHRKSGLMNLTARASVAAMRELNYDTSILFGIPKFYHRFGYTRAWSREVTVIAAGDLPNEQPELPVRKLSAVHRAELTSLYNREDRSVTGTAVRPTYRRDCYGQPLEGCVWKNGDDAVTGYVIYKTASCEIVEAVGDVEQTLRVIAVLARRGGWKEVRFVTLPYTSAIARRFRHGTCRIETRHMGNGGPMIALINLPAALKRMTSELSKRFAASQMADWEGGLIICDSRDKAMLQIRRRQVTVEPVRPCRNAIRGGNEVAQLLIGTDHPLEIAAARGTRLTGEAGQLVSILFPQQHPVLRLCDEF